MRGTPEEHRQRREAPRQDCRARETGGPKFPAAIVFWIHKVKLYSLVTTTLVSLYRRYAIYFISALNEKKIKGFNIFLTMRAAKES